jgi:hypothetical protein
MSAPDAEPARTQEHPTEHSDKPDGKKASLWRRPVVWLGGVLGALILAAATAFGTGVGQTLWSSATAPPAPHGPPVKLEAVSPLEFYEFKSYVLPTKLVLTAGQLAAMNAEVGISSTGYVNWFRRRGGVLAVDGLVAVTIVSNSDSPVTIKEIDVVKRCQAPLHGTLFNYVLGAGAPSVPQVTFNLDQLVAVGQYGPPPGPGYPAAGGNFFAKKVVTVGPRERPQTLDLFVQSSHYCQFTFQMKVATPKGMITENISNDGRPFRITGGTNLALFGAVYTISRDYTRFIRVKPKP